MEKIQLTRLDQEIGRKQAALPEGVCVVSPSENLPSDLQADWLIFLLSRMYVRHGITSRRDGLIQDIETGGCRVWFAAKDEHPLAAAALVTQSDGAVELGRAVSLQKGIGGLLMLQAAREHLENSPDPLVAEVRISDEFAGVPSGLATQTVCLRHLELMPHAFVPAFHHGDPVRQEFFAFASSSPLPESAPLLVPDDLATVGLLTSTIMNLATDRFAPSLVQQPVSLSPQKRWEIVSQTAPFAILTPQATGVALDTAVAVAESESPFTLIPVEASAQNSGALLACLNAGFIPCGIDRNIGPIGHPVMLLGKVRSGTLIAPVKILPVCLTKSENFAADAITGSFLKT